MSLKYGTLEFESRCRYSKRSAMRRTKKAALKKAHHMSAQAYLVKQRKAATKINNLKRAPGIKKNREWYESYKVANPCTDCGLYYPAECMDFDHITGDKQFTVSQMITRCYGKEAIDAEISKCQLVCSNCHRTRTRLRKHGAAREKNSQKLLLKYSPWPTPSPSS